MLSSESTKPCKRQQHLEKDVLSIKIKMWIFSNAEKQQQKKPGLMQMEVSNSKKFQTAVEASYVVLQQIARTKTSHTICERLVLSACKDIVSLILGNDTAKKLNILSTSNDTVKHRICEMSEDIKKQVVHKIKHSAFIDIFDSLNDLNLSLHGKCSTLIDLTNIIRAFQINLDLWCRKLDSDRYDMFPTLSSFSKEKEVNIDSALKVMAEQFPTEDIHTQDQFVDTIDDDDEVKAKFTQLPPKQFWCSVASEYPLVSEMALKVLLLFPTIYAYENGFSSLLTTKTKS
ncbi:hypothetical protein KIL84_010866 [Mauremys mutica]|uniref:HAT C-terminal dimerisation domain-containing protein n=1 Tax=Mauremys mutica TaxID=74926 RepID=A0A9D4B1E1_9SAUR|nr:hypothetical protein KIL84_010866 [Mauremys mutica]